MQKTVRVKLIGEAQEEYTRINRVVGDEVRKGLHKSDHQVLLRSIEQKIEFIRSNPQYGEHIEKNKIPKEYVKLYEINNLWKVNLSGAWRLLYTLRGDQIEILAIILDLLNHKDYSKKFGYRK